MRWGRDAVLIVYASVGFSGVAAASAIIIGASTGTAVAHGGSDRKPANTAVPPRAISKPRTDPCPAIRRLGVARSGTYSWHRTPRIGVSIHKSYAITFNLGHDVGQPQREFTINLAVSTAPRAANTILFLACSGYYTGSQFYRVIAHRLLEGGSPPRGGGPGFSNPVEPTHGSFGRGTVAMVDPASTSRGSRFFILLAPVTLPPRYTIVGTVSRGLAVLDAASRVPVTLQPDAHEFSRPRQVLAITAASVYVR